MLTLIFSYKQLKLGVTESKDPIIKFDKNKFSSYEMTQHKNHLENCKTYGKKCIGHEMCVLFFSITFVQNMFCPDKYVMSYT
jgi:hypothetical protein